MNKECINTNKVWKKTKLVLQILLFFISTSILFYILYFYICLILTIKCLNNYKFQISLFLFLFNQFFESIYR